MSQTPSTPASDLIVRQHERYRCSLAAVARIAGESAGRVSPSPSVTESGGIRVSVVDCSAGGLGLRSSVFLPKSAELDVELQAGAGQSPAVVRVRIQRVAMLDRTPSYYLGCAMTDATDAGRAALGHVLDMAKAHGEPVPLTGSGGQREGTPRA
ncbi:MAG: PilZ domain-containing protein [Phycisphaerales bacterium]|nr:PilZ domain-containing protein [Phycisphaerales bacterium]